MPEMVEVEEGLEDLLIPDPDSDELGLEEDDAALLHLIKNETTAVAHRGFSARHPENTVSAVAAACAVGAEAVEIDVHATADGEVVVHHDGVIEMIAPKPRQVAISSAPLWALRTMHSDDAGPHSAEASEVPLLAEVLAAVASSEFTDLHIELKDPDQAAVNVHGSRTAARNHLVDAVVRVLTVFGYNLVDGHAGIPRHQISSSAKMNVGLRFLSFESSMLDRIPAPDQDKTLLRGTYQQWIEAEEYLDTHETMGLGLGGQALQRIDITQLGYDLGGRHFNIWTLNDVDSICAVMRSAAEHEIIPATITTNDLRTYDEAMLWMISQMAPSVIDGDGIDRRLERIYGL